MYVEPNFPTKKALKEAVADPTKRVTVFQPNDMFGKTDEIKALPVAEVTIEGPHYPKPHKWYARVRCEYGKVVKVLG